MNRRQQEDLIRMQVSQIAQNEHLQVLPQDGPLKLHVWIRSFSGRKYLLELGLATYDLFPPGVRVLKADMKPTYSRQNWPPPPFTNLSPHPSTGRIFCCQEGTYEYHSHPLHSHESWDARRNFWPLAKIVGRLAASAQKPPGVPSVQSRRPAV